MKAFLVFFILVNSLTAFAEGKKVAIVKILRGDVDVLTLGKTTRLKVEDWVEDGATVKTGDKSFVKLLFVDKSQMNVAANSEMKIEKFSENDSGVIDLVKGQIRSKVTKDYLQMKDKDKSKLFIKTPNAVMGIRGTDFMIKVVDKKSIAILFEGSVAWNRTDVKGKISTAGLENIVNQGERMAPGEFSVAYQERSRPTIPSRLNVQQFEALEKNDTFDARNPSSGNEEAKKSVVPNGLNGQVVSNDTTILKNEVAQTIGAPVVEAKGTGSASEANGYLKGDALKPANGSFVHIESGTIIPPTSDSVYDPNTNTYIVGPDAGKVGPDGAYIPNKGTEITSSGQILKVVIGADGKAVVEVQKPISPVKTEAPKVTQQPLSGSGANQTTTTSVFNPGGNLKPSVDAPPVGTPTNVNQAAQQFQDTGARVRTIRVNN